MDGRHGAARMVERGQPYKGERVVVIATSYPVDPDDPAGHFVRAEALSLARAGADVHVIAPSPYAGDPGVNAHAAGGTSLFAQAGQHSPWLEWEALIAADPDVILLLPCGFTIAQSLADLHLLTARPGWAGLNAVRAGRVFVIDGHHYFNRPGPRLVESAEMIAEILNPGLFDFGHKGVGWIPVQTFP